MWKHITPFLFKYNSGDNIEIFKKNLNENFTRIFNKASVAHGGYIKCFVKKVS